MEFRLPERIRDEYDEMGEYRIYKGKRRYRSTMYEKMAFKWVEENMRCPDCQGSLMQRPWSRTWRREFGNVICQGCGKEFTLVSSIVPMLGTVRMPSYLKLLQAIEEKNLPDFILLTYERDSLDIRYLMYLMGDTLTPEFIRPGWRPIEDDEHDIWCDIEAGRLNYVRGGAALAQLYPEPDEEGE